MPMGIGIGMSLGEYGGRVVFSPSSISSLQALYVPTDYSANSSIAVLKNKATTTPVLQNYGRAPRRLFGGGFPVVYTAAGITITDAAFAFDDGTNDASRLNCTGAWSLVYNGYPLAAGTWTIAIWVKSNTGVAQQFRMGNVSAATFITQTTTASTWQRFTYTFTLGSPGSPVIGFALNLAGASADLLVIDAHIFSGSSDLAPTAAQLNAGHIEFGTSPTAGGIPTYSNGVLDCSSGAKGLAQFASGSTKTNTSTVVALVKRSAAGFNAGFQPIVSKYGGSWANWSSGLILGTGAGQYVGTEHGSVNATSPSDVYGPATMFNAQGNGWAVVTFRVNGTTGDAWINKLSMRSVTGLSLTTQTVQDMCFNMLQGQYYSGNQYGPVAIFDSALTTAQIGQMVDWMKSYAAANNITMQTQKTVIVDGMSIAAGQAGSPGYANLMMGNLATKAFGQNFATGGALVSTLSARQATVIAQIQAAQAFGPVTLCVDIGTNDLISGTAATLLPALATLLDTYRATGCKVVGGTILPRNDAGSQPNHDTQRLIANPTIVGWVGTHLDAIADVASDATMGAFATASDGVNYNTDKIHPTTQGHSKLEPYWRAAIAAAG